MNEDIYTEDTEIIPINAEDIEETIDSILENSNVFKKSGNIENVRCIIFYVDSKNAISYKKYEIPLKYNILPKSQLVTLILENKKNHSREFDLTGIYKFEIDLNEDKIKEFCKNSELYSFIKEYKKIQDIKFSPGIELFNDANNIILFFTKKNKALKQKEQQPTHNKTKKRVKFTSPLTLSNDESSNNKTSKNRT